MNSTFIEPAYQGNNQVWRYIVIILAVIFVTLAVQIAAAIPFILIEQTSDITQFPPLSLLIVALVPFPFAGMTVLAGVRWLHGRPVKTLFRPAGRFEWGRLITSAALWFGMLALGDVVLSILQPGNYRWTFDPLQSLPYFVIALLLLPLQTTTEEIIFRGYLTQWMGGLGRSPWLALIVPSVLFALLHGANPEVGKYGFWLTMPFYLGIGLLLGWITLRSQGLEHALGLHAANNLYAAIFVTFPSSAIPSPAFFTIREYDPLTGLVVFAIMAVVYLAALYLLRSDRVVKTIPALLLAVGMAAALAQPAAAKSYFAERFDVRVEVQRNGDLLVTETVAFHFVGGPFTFAYRDITKNELDSLAVVEMRMDGQSLPRGNQPGQAEVVEDGDSLEVTWHFEPTSDTSRVFELTYRVIGNLRQADQRDSLVWQVIPMDHEYVIQASEIRLVYPPGITPLTDPLLRGRESQAQSGAGEMVFRLNDIPANESLVLEAQFPAGILIQQPPGWQAAQMERNRQMVSGLPYAGGLAALIAIAAAALLVRVRRESQVEAPLSIPTGTLSNPPDDLSPAAASYLINNGRGTVMQVFGVVLDMARRALITLDFHESGGLFKARDFQIHKAAENAAHRPHEAYVVEMLFDPKISGRSGGHYLSVFGQKMAQQLSGFNRALQGELVQQGLILEKNIRLRQQLTILSTVLFIFAFALGIIAVVLIGALISTVTVGMVLLGAAVGIIIAAVLGWIFSAQIAALTPAGMTRRGRWLAFQDYIKSLTKRENQTQLQGEWLENYLPYAVAFGMGDRWVKAFRDRGLSTILSWAQTTDDDGIDGSVLTAVIVTSSADAGGDSGGGGGGGGGGSSGAG
ncbi:MAG: DUF2207 domain-containing protein [Bellilinea sp.]